MAFDLLVVSQFIASLSMTGITVKDYGTLADEFDSREFPILAPDLFQPVTIQAVTRNSFGDGTTAKQTLYYLVPYVLAVYSQGEGRGVRDVVPGIIAAMSTVATALIKHDTPADLSVDLTIQAATCNVLVNDPQGTNYHGAKLMLLVKEFIEGIH
jgi:hypothetical protein